jgi:hypothetical protein
MDQEAVYYLSIVVDDPNRLDELPSDKWSEGVRLTFRSSQEYAGENVSFGIGPKLQPQIQTDTGVGATIRWNPISGRRIWVAKITAHRDRPDTANFHMYNNASEIEPWEPSDWLLTCSEFQHNRKLDLVVLTSYGRHPRFVERLRIGPTWRSVVPADLKNQ